MLSSHDHHLVDCGSARGCNRVVEKLAADDILRQRDVREGVIAGVMAGDAATARGFPHGETGVVAHPQEPG
eukprot:CAMPEP_0198119032 /NCGR_PEP_ID=MMETSP1442-20131203/24039_1 /TAXON_ID= /ORGANISM="Craspedostauros australis, Strain CCMP3328" /LENGTH=70 /DNA_ID=CAMNT_0043777413 /DNA_START=141 /DNA_END=349 /DNA_ORIENTATION=-